MSDSGYSRTACVSWEPGKLIRVSVGQSDFFLCLPHFTSLSLSLSLLSSPRPSCFPPPSSSPPPPPSLFLNANTPCLLADTYIIPNTRIYTYRQMYRRTSTHIHTHARARAPTPATEYWPVPYLMIHTTFFFLFRETATEHWTTIFVWMMMIGWGEKKRCTINTANWLWTSANKRAHCAPDAHAYAHIIMYVHAAHCCWLFASRPSNMLVYLRDVFDQTSSPHWHRSRSCGSNYDLPLLTWTP